MVCAEKVSCEPKLLDAAPNANVSDLYIATLQHASLICDFRSYRTPKDLRNDGLIWLRKYISHHSGDDYQKKDAECDLQLSGR